MSKPLNFEDALYAMKMGQTVKRRSWPDNVWVFMAPAAAVTVPHKYGGGYHVEPTLWLKTEHDGLTPWSISHADVLTDDWDAVANPQRQDQKAISHS